MSKKNKTNIQLFQPNALIILPIIVSSLSLFLMIIMIRSFYLVDRNLFNNFLTIAFISWVTVLIPMVLTVVVQLVSIKSVKGRAIQLSNETLNKLYLGCSIFILLWVPGVAYYLTNQAHSWQHPIDYWLIALLPIGYLTLFAFFAKTFFSRSKQSPRKAAINFTLAALAALLLLFIISYVFFILFITFSL